MHNANLKPENFNLKQFTYETAENGTKSFYLVDYENNYKYRWNRCLDFRPSRFKNIYI